MCRFGLLTDENEKNISLCQPIRSIVGVSANRTARNDDEKEDEDDKIFLMPM